jgi:hypothetical protein
VGRKKNETPVEPSLPISCGRETPSLSASHAHTLVAVENDAARFTHCFSTTLPPHPRSTTLGPRSSVSHTMKIFRSLFFVLLFFETFRSRPPGGGGDRLGFPLFGQLVASAAEVLSGGSSTAEPAAVDDDPTCRVLGSKGGGWIKEDVCAVSDGPGEVGTEEVDETTAEEVGFPVARLPGSTASTERTNGRPLGVQGESGRKNDETGETSESTGVMVVRSPGGPTLPGSLEAPPSTMREDVALARAYRSYPAIRANYDAVVNYVLESAPRGRGWWTTILCSRVPSTVDPLPCFRASSHMVREACHWSEDELQAILSEFYLRGASGGGGGGGGGDEDTVMLRICKTAKARLVGPSSPSVGGRPAESLDGDRLPRGTLETFDCF